MDECELTEEEFLATYDASKWPHPALTADIVVFRWGDSGLELLLIKRGNHPFKDCWALPGGFFEPGERIEETATRELLEETGVEGAALELVGIYSAPNRDPRDWVVTAAYMTLLPEGVQVQAGDDAADVKWFPVIVDVQEIDGKEVVRLACSAPDVCLTSVFTTNESWYLDATKAHILESNGFAFDHAEIIADAWLNSGKTKI